jgi:hypothetical protein
MAIYKIFPEKDTTIYSAYPTTNTGLDPILEIQNQKATTSTTAQVSRILLKFPPSEISASIARTGGTGLYSASLKLSIADATNLPDNYTLYCYPVSQSWQAGTGKFLFDPPYTDDCTWVDRDNNNLWRTSGFAANSTASFLPGNAGGSTWVTNYVGSQSFSINETKDTDINVTSLVTAFNSGTLANDGILIKMEGGYEFNTSSSFALKYFSKDTHTIYLPQLEIKWDDSSFVTGALTVLTDGNNAITLGNNIGEYNRNDIYQFRVNARNIYPTRQFVTQSVFTLNKALPSSSYWALQDLDTGEYVVDFDESSTKISCDTAGNFFTLYTAGLQPARYYKILIKSSFSNGSTVVYDNDYIFKINK